MKKYEVRVVDVKTKTGVNAEEKFLRSDNQTTEIVKSFEKLEEARKCYDDISTSVRYMSGYYLHHCKLIEENEYDDEDDDEWISGGYWHDAEFPDKEGVERE